MDATLELDPITRESPRGHVVLHQPEIPNNTGSIGRTCVAFGFSLHLIHPLGFDTDEKACRRAGLDYWPRLGVSEHQGLDQCLQEITGLSDRVPRIWALTTRGKTPIQGMQFERGDVLLFGQETKGLPADVVEKYEDSSVRIPLVREERSLNLSVSAGIAMQAALNCDIR